MATIKIFRYTGTTPDEHDITSQNTLLQAADIHETEAASNPIVVPETGENMSFWASARLRVTENEQNHTINNMKWYTDGSNDLGTGLNVDVALASAYDQAVGDEGVAGSAIDGNHGHIISAPADAFNYTSESPLDIDATAPSTTGTGDIGDYVVCQGKVGASNLGGESNQEEVVFQWDQQ